MVEDSIVILKEKEKDIYKNNSKNKKDIIDDEESKIKIKILNNNNIKNEELNIKKKEENIKNNSNKLNYLFGKEKKNRFESKKLNTAKKKNENKLNAKGKAENTLEFSLNITKSNIKKKK